MEQIHLNSGHVRFALTLAIIGLAGTGVSFNSANADNNPSGGGLYLPNPSQQEIREPQQQQVRRTNPNVEKYEDETKFDFGKQTPQIGLQGTNNFFLNDVQFEGNTLLPPDLLSQIVAPYKGRQTSLDELSELVDKVNQQYWDRGYLTSQAVIPPQDVSYGTLKIQIFEGRLGKVNLEGNRFTRSGVIMKRLNLEEGQVINFSNLEENLNRINNQNRFKVRAALSPGANTGESDITLKVADPNPWQITPTFDNQGRPLIGTQRGGLQVDNYNLTGNNDHLVTRLNHTYRMTNINAGYYVPVSQKWGTTLGIAGGYLNARPDFSAFTPTPPEIINRVWQGSVSIAQPLNKSRTLTLDGGFNYADNRSTTSGASTLNERTRAFFLGLNFDYFDRWGRTYGRVDNTGGVDALGATRGYYVARGAITRLQRLPWDNLLIARINGQWTPNTLPLLEGFPLGGEYSVRGFTEGLLLGDRGYNLSIEDRFHLPFLKEVSPWWDDRLRGAVFFDMGQAFIDKSNSRFIGTDSKNTMLMGAGAGLRVAINQYLTGFLDVGFPFGDRNNLEVFGNPTARVHFGIRSDFVRDGSYNTVRNNRNN